MATSLDRARLYELAWAVERDGYLTLAECQAIGRPHPDDSL